MTRTGGRNNTILQLDVRCLEIVDRGGLGGVGMQMMYIWGFMDVKSNPFLWLFG